MSHQYALTPEEVASLKARGIIGTAPEPVMESNRTLAGEQAWKKRRAAIKQCLGKFLYHTWKHDDTCRRCGAKKS